MSLDTVDTGGSAPVSETVTVDTAAPVTDAAAVVENAADEKPSYADVDQELLKVYEKHNPPRINGKFAPRAATETISDAPIAAASDTESADLPEENKVETAKPSIEPPNSWSAEQKAKWATVPPETQTYIAKREMEAHQAITRAGEQVKQYEQVAKSYEPLGQVLRGYQGEFQRLGLSPEQGISTLLQVHTRLVSDPVNGLIDLGRSMGVDLVSLLQGQAAQQQDGAAPPSPEVSQLRNELAQIRSHLTEQQRHQVATQEQAQAQARANQERQHEEVRATLSKEIADFAKDKPHFEAVKPIMAGLMSVGAAETLADAYDKATHANPEIRQRILADQRKAEDGKRVAEAAKKTADAKKSASVNVRSSTANGNTPRSMDDTLREIATKHYGRVA